MPRVSIADNEFISVLYYPRLGLIAHHIHPLNREYSLKYRSMFRDALNKGLGVMKAEKVHKWLSDDRYADALPLEDVEWGQEVWAPKAIIAGWRYWGIIPPATAVPLLSWRNLIRKFEELGVTAQVFDSVETAETWLSSK